MTLRISQVPCGCHPMPGNLPWNSLCFSCASFAGVSFSFFITSHSLGWEIVLSLTSTATILTSLLDCSLQFSQIHLLLFGHRTPDCLGVDLTFNLPHERCLFRLCKLTSGHSNMDGLHIITLLHAHLNKVRHHSIKIIATLVWLGLDHINHCLKLVTTFLVLLEDHNYIIN